MSRAFTKIQTEDEELRRVQDNIAQHAQSLISALTPQWTHVPILGNGWAAFVGAGNVGSVRGYPAGVWYLKDASGFVHLRGLITGGTQSGGADGTVFTLPPLCRPLYQETFGQPYSGRVDVLDIGDVRVNTTAFGWASLAGITFLAEG
jgi:hypothetical protein